MILYILNFVLCSGLLLLVYRVFLRNENLYLFNWFYLLFSLVFSLVVPFITIKIIAAQAPVLGQQIIERSVVTIMNNPVHQQLLQAPGHSSHPDIWLALYAAIAVILLLRFARNLYQISQTISCNMVVDGNDAKLVLLDDEVTPHSFLKYIFLNKKDYHNALIEPEIICHEQAHVKQLHSLDMLLIEVVHAICWFNPFIPFFRRAIQLNHEFLADEAVLKNYNNTTGYQYLVLAKASQLKSLYITSQFNYSATKKRLIMMTINTSVKIALYKRLALIPVLAGALLFFSHKDMAQSASAAVKNAYKNIAATMAKINLPGKELTDAGHSSANHKSTLKTKQGSSFSMAGSPDTVYNRAVPATPAALADSSKTTTGISSGNGDPKTAKLLKKMQGMEVTADGTLKQNEHVATQSILDSIPVYENGVLTHYWRGISADKVKKISIDHAPGDIVVKMAVYADYSHAKKSGADSAGTKVQLLLINKL